MIARIKRWVFRQYQLRIQNICSPNGVKLCMDGLSCKMRKIIVAGGYETAETWACREVIKAGDDILELGGAIGYIGLHCLINCKAKAVLSAEPNPKTAHLLRRNYQINGLQPRVIETAITEGNGPIKFLVGNDFWADGIDRVAEDQVEIQVSGTNFITLWNTITPKPNVIIIDIEGAELNIPFNNLPPQIERIIIELHPRSYGTQMAFSILHTIMNSGFKVIYHNAEVYALERLKY